MVIDSKPVKSASKEMPELKLEEDVLQKEDPVEEKFGPEKKQEKEEEAEKFPEFAEYPLADRVKELNLMSGYPDSNPEFYEDLKTKPMEFFLRAMPDSVAKSYYPEICRRFIDIEKRIKIIENLLWNLPREDRSMEEDRFEILTELLDKAANGLEIWDEHIEKRIPMEQRLHLEGQLCDLIDAKFKIIETTCANFDELKGDQSGVNNEREWLRYEIRHCDLRFYEIHEAFLTVYLAS